MPITNGYQACESILEFLKKNKEICVKNSGNRNLVESLILDAVDKPIMVACSAFVDESIRHYAIKAGFDVVIESPLTANIIEDEILTRLE